MIEQDIRETYRRMAETVPPPARISVPAAGRAGRARRRRRRARLIAAPVLAAAAVLAIAIASVAVTGNGTTPIPATGSTAAPAHFSLARPYGWIPGQPHSTMSGVTMTRIDEIVNYSRTTGSRSFTDFYVFAADQCHVTAQKLLCATHLAVKLGPRVTTLNGFPAYWNPGGAGLTWQYARRGWAQLAIGGARKHGLAEILRLARSARFGTQAAPPFVYPLQLRSVPADWQVGAVASNTWHGRVLTASTFTLTAGSVDLPADNTPKAPRTPQFVMMNGAGAVCPSGFGRSTTRLVNGMKVRLYEYAAGAPLFLCALNADGLNFTLEDSARPKIGVIALFASHIRLLGPDPAHWTTRPIG